MKIAEILRRKEVGVRTVGPDARIREIIGNFEAFGVGSLVVIDGPDVVGIVTERDIVQGYAQRGSRLGSAPVNAVMSPVLKCAPDDDVAAVSWEMTARRQRHIVVILEGKLHGIVSIGDLVKHRLDECRLEVAVLRDYARTHTTTPAA
jgi:CBS domain-containing protein